MDLGVIVDNYRLTATEFVGFSLEAIAAVVSRVVACAQDHLRASLQRRGILPRSGGEAARELRQFRPCASLVD